MTDINNVNLVGRLTRDIDIRYTQSGTAIGSCAIACNRSIKKGEQWEDEASFFDVTVFGKMAEGLKDYLTKGKQIAVSGYLKQDRWQKDGQNFSKVGIVAESIQLLGGEKKEQSAPSRGGNRIAPNNVSAVADAVDGEVFQEDIPF